MLELVQLPLGCQETAAEAGRVPDRQVASVENGEDTGVRIDCLPLEPGFLTRRARSLG